MCCSALHVYLTSPSLPTWVLWSKTTSRYRDNLYICLAYVPDKDLELVKMILAIILKMYMALPSNGKTVQRMSHGEKLAFGVKPSRYPWSARGVRSVSMAIPRASGRLGCLHHLLTPDLCGIHIL